MTPNEVPINRPQVYKWHKDWADDNGDIEDPEVRKMSFELYLRKEIDDLKLPDEWVNTSSSDSLPEETHIADMIMGDISSYVPDGI